MPLWQFGAVKQSKTKELAMSIAEIIQMSFLSLIGLGVGFGFLFFVFYRDAYRWHYLERAYHRPWGRPLKLRRFQNAVAYGKGVASKSYNGLLTIGLHETGIALRILAPFSFFHRPLFIPFSDIRGWEQDWYLNSKTFELEFDRAPEVKIVMPASQVNWMKESASGAMQISNAPSPNKDRPGLWYAIILVQGILALGMLGYVITSWPKG